ncbi:uncharacterized protein LOC107883431 [Acyrthosiphon pisum]|uniref:Uncharacterized protein n=1 Tax=Acyrthosiphon pisum TaxID=7029 RepID=A0A8R2NSS0_ACYPI|nr:uncharacterized protein LOC107883431 [Acyrthosiphon pisum]
MQSIIKKVFEIRMKNIIKQRCQFHQRIQKPTNSTVCSIYLRIHFYTNVIQEIIKMLMDMIHLYLQSLRSVTFAISLLILQKKGRSFLITWGYNKKKKHIIL